LVGWGHQPYVTEFGATGRTLFDLRFGQGSDSYRAFRLRWVGRPLDRPAIAVKGTTAYVSWNGATEGAAWRLVGDGEAIRRTGFETAIPVPDGLGRVEIEALDAEGHVLGMSPSVSVH